MNSRTIKQFFIFVLLFAFVLLVNRDIISLNYIYQEQPEIYFANSQIHSLSDFLNLYLHPNMFNVFYIPFFRPSGHFLIYQLLAPILGWQNNQGMLAINFLFLALTGFYVIKLYQLLFPRMMIGAYIAFALYLMHPALILSRLIVLHFEFAYVCLVTMATYYFVTFCQSHYSCVNPEVSEVRFNRFGGLALVILLYALAITFKESAVLLGPVLAAYLCISLYSGQSVIQYTRELWRNSAVRNVFLLLSVISLAFLLYLTLQWPTLQNPVKQESNWQITISSAAELIKILLASPYNLLPDSIYSLYHSRWREFVYSDATRVLIWTCILFTVSSIWLLRKNNSDTARVYRKSTLFLFVSAMIYLSLPLCWGMGLPWHLNLTLLSLSMLAGFGFEYMLDYMKLNTEWRTFIGGTLALLIGLSTLVVNQQNITFAKAKYKYEFLLMTSAVSHPPAIKTQLNEDSVIVVEDRTAHDGYTLGNYYPLSDLFTLGTYDVHELERSYSRSFLKFQSIYGGTLFRWVYSMPALREEVIPFEIDKMNKLPDIVVYNWLQHQNNIFCLGYDESGNWYDKTEAFKKNLSAENARRKLTVNSYQSEANMKWQGKPIGQLEIYLPEPSICKLQCDQARLCHGFTYADVAYQGHHFRKCFYFSKSDLSAATKSACKTCTLFIKG